MVNYPNGERKIKGFKEQAHPGRKKRTRVTNKIRAESKNSPVLISFSSNQTHLEREDWFNLVYEINPGKDSHF